MQMCYLGLRLVKLDLPSFINGPITFISVPPLQIIWACILYFVGHGRLVSKVAIYSVSFCKWKQNNNFVVDLFLFGCLTFHWFSSKEGESYWTIYMLCPFLFCVSKEQGLVNHSGKRRKISVRIQPSNFLKIVFFQRSWPSLAQDVSWPDLFVNRVPETAHLSLPHAPSDRRLYRVQWLQIYFYCGLSLWDPSFARIMWFFFILGPYTIISKYGLQIIILFFIW